MISVGMSLIPGLRNRIEGQPERLGLARRERARSPAQHVDALPRDFLAGIVVKTQVTSASLHRAGCPCS